MGPRRQLPNRKWLWWTRSSPGMYRSLPTSTETTLIALGGADPSVQLYLPTADLSFSAKLQGHQNWIRCLAFHQPDTALLLATASTDTTARIWRITDAADETVTLVLTLPNTALAFKKQSLLDEHTKAAHTVSFRDGHLLTASMDCGVAV